MVLKAWVNSRDPTEEEGEGESRDTPHERGEAHVRHVSRLQSDPAKLQRGAVILAIGTTPCPSPCKTTRAHCNRWIHLMGTLNARCNAWFIDEEVVERLMRRMYVRSIEFCALCAQTLNSQP